MFYFFWKILFSFLFSTQLSAFRSISARPGQCRWYFFRPSSTECFVFSSWQWSGRPWWSNGRKSKTVCPNWRINVTNGSWHNKYEWWRLLWWCCRCVSADSFQLPLMLHFFWDSVNNYLRQIFAAEHVLNIISIVHYSNLCPTQHKDPIKEFFKAQLNQLFTFTEYAPWKAFLGKCLNVICTFIWTYMDVFVMVLSVGLANRFKLLNDDLMQTKGEVHIFWSTPMQCSHSERFYFFIRSLRHKSFGQHGADSIAVYAHSANWSMMLSRK